MSATSSVASPYALSPLTVAQAFVDGRAAGQTADRAAETCPYPPGSHEHGAWWRGFNLACSPLD